MHPIYREDLERAVSEMPGADAFRGARVLITGVTGMIGACLMDALTLLNERGWGMTLYGVSRCPEGREARFPGAKLIAADMTRPDAPLPEVDFIIHAASNAHPAAFSSDPVGTMLGNLTGAHQLLERLRRAGSGRMLFVSTGEIYGDNPAIIEGFCETDFGRVDSMNPRSCYPESKRAAETLCASYARQYGVDAVVARLSYVYGPTLSDANTRADAQFLRKALAGEDIVLKSPGLQRRTYTYVTDAIAGLLTILTRGETGEAYNVAAPMGAITIRGYAEALAALAGVSLRFDIPSEQEQKGYSTVTNAIQRSEKLQALGWTARYSVPEGLKRMWDVLTKP